VVFRAVQLCIVLKTRKGAKKQRLVSSQRQAYPTAYSKTRGGRLNETKQSSPWGYSVNVSNEKGNN
jgi:hypothetical protein